MIRSVVNDKVLETRVESLVATCLRASEMPSEHHLQIEWPLPAGDKSRSIVNFTSQLPRGSAQ